ncbi:glycosyltransferase family 4 protein [Paraherbaspirillum soli]|uniref:Glycosyltransferase family 4 protein n=1 Tax=Paraherbaspirillum soli TaxID=631222 RepID=A0ABW0MAU3_9BURK
MKKKIVYVINHAAFFVSHRLPLAIAAREAGWDVHLLIGQPGSAVMEPLAEAELKRQGLPYTRLSFRTVGFNPVWELIGVLQLLWHIARMRPSVVHTASPKGGLYGGLSSRLLRVPCLVVAVSGMGFLFTGHANGLKGMLKRLYSLLLAWVYRHPNITVIVQNQDDKQALLQSGAVQPNDLILIPGAGVALSNYASVRTDDSQRLVVLPARLLRDKGVEEFVTAAKMLKEQGSDWRFALVGTADYANPSAIPEAQVKAWADAGLVEWWGHREDMPLVYAQADIVCLPSYREGMPKCLLEAAAAGCAVVTSDVTGCREAIIPGETGDLVPAREAAALASVLAKLIAEPDRRRRYGEAGRILAAARFGMDAVLKTTLNIYDGLLARAASVLLGGAEGK